MYSSPEELREHIPRAQLTADVGGTLKYDHQEWIQQRAVSTWFFILSTVVDMAIISRRQFRINVMNLMKPHKIIVHFENSILK